ncbi:MAG TPA: TerC/Alx family metal homeostasis membrane protein [Cyclobacteriaceae bacterium]|nr:TerC/Alx family metal homeostasis membrane protein [Cyclobacteriaceae bacterium]
MLLTSLLDSSNTERILFGVFALIILVFLLLDLGVFHKTNRKTTTRSALLQSIFWVFISTLFGVFIYFYDKDGTATGTEAAFEYFSAYLTEYALSVDNIFVILLILKYFNVKEEYYHKILFWGILGAVVFRGVFIFVGAILIEKFEWILYILGVLLIYSGIKIYFEDSDEKIDPEKNPIMRLCKKYLPITSEDHGGAFLITQPKWQFTTLFLVVVLIETTDLIFAVDSIPAAFAITTNPFLIYTSNIFAVLGLRAMFFMLAGIIDKFYLLQKGLSIILFFIGTKMLLGIFEIHVAVELSFTVIVVTLALSILFSVLIPKKQEQKEMPIDSEL